MDRARDCKSAAIDRGVRRVDVVAIAVDLDQRRCGDLVVEQVNAVDQEMLGRSGYSRRDARVDQVRPAKQVDQPVAGRKIDPRPPLDLAHPRPRYRRHRHIAILSQTRRLTYPHLPTLTVKLTQIPPAPK